MFISPRTSAARRICSFPISNFLSTQFFSRRKRPSPHVTPIARLAPEDANSTQRDLRCTAPRSRAKRPSDAPVTLETACKAARKAQPNCVAIKAAEVLLRSGGGDSSKCTAFEKFLRLVKSECRPQVLICCALRHLWVEVLALSTVCASMPVTSP